ncbi:MAG: M20 family metallopeptidase [Acidimicrobiales bacterium]
MRDLVDAGRVVDLTSELVAIDTRNPPGNERAAAGACRRALSRWEPEVTEVEPAPGRLSLVARLPHPDGPGSRPTLIVNGHLDVVPVLGSAWSHDPFDPQEIDGRLFGRGTADMKGGIAAAICALDVVERSGRPRRCDVVLHLVADEERGGSLGTRALLDQGLVHGDACLVPEPTSMQLCVAERGLLQGWLSVHGRPGHGSQPRQGVSAIEHAAAIVLALHGADFGDPDHPLLGRPSANVGTVEGGSGFNTVAEWCRLGFDRRVLPGATREAAEAGIRARVEGAGIDGLRYQLEVEVFGEASEMSPDHPFVRLVGDAVTAATGERPELVGMPFTTDARFVRNQAGIPAVVCGPGEIGCAHANDEWVAVERLVDATAAYAELLATFG